MSVYLDVLLVLNIYVNYFLLKATAKLTHTKLRTSKCVFASIGGSLFSLAILLPPLNFFITLSIKLIAALVVVALAFGFSDWKRYIKMTLFFFAVNFIFAGVMLAVYLLVQPSFMGFNNTFFYIDFSLMTLVVSTIIAYAAVSIVRYFLDRKAVFNEKYLVIMSVKGNTIAVNAVADTGNTLTDVFSGQPVIICGRDNLKGILSDEFKAVLSSDNAEELQNYILTHKELKGMRLVPFSTINSSGMIPIFSPDNIYIKAESTNECKSVSAMVGICENQGNNYEAIFNPCLII